MTQSKQFDDILNECLERVLLGESIEDCLAGFPQHAAELRPLLETSLQVKKAASVQPRPEFRASSGAKFRIALNALPDKPKRSFLAWLRQPQWAAVTAAVLLVVMGTGTGVMASGSMPDQPLYSVKLVMEKVQISLTPSAAAKGELYARILEKRIDEISRMASENKPDKIQLVTTRLDSFVAQIAGSNFRDMESGNLKTTAAPPMAPGFAPADRSKEDAVSNTTIAAVAPDQGLSGIAAAGTNETAADTGNFSAAAAEIATIPSGIPALEQAAANLARLRTLLRTVPDSERPVLEAAVTAAEKTYEALSRYLSVN